MTTALTYDNALTKETAQNRVNLICKVIDKVEEFKFHVMGELHQVRKDYLTNPITAYKCYGYETYEDVFEAIRERCKKKWHKTYMKSLADNYKLISYVEKNYPDRIHVFSEINDIGKITLLRQAWQDGHIKDLPEWLEKAVVLNRDNDLKKELNALKKGTHKDPIQADRKPDKQVTDDLRNYLKDLEGMSASYIPRESVVKKIKSILA